MECLAVTEGKGVRELYHLGFSGTHFQFIFSAKDWETVAEKLVQFGYKVFSGAVEHSSSKGGDTSCEPRGYATISILLDSSVCLSIAAVSSSDNVSNSQQELRAGAHTISDFLAVLNGVLSRDREECVDHEMRQLFHPNTFVGEGFHGAALDLSVSFVARHFLERFEAGTQFDGAVSAMLKYYNALFPPTGDEYVGDLRRSFEARVREGGLLHFYTMGNCACLGAMPDKESDRGHYLSSHNVDNVWQQLSLLAAIASVWQMMRDGAIL
ncbi:MAG: hypothetical protein ACYC8S_03635 [Minisyncoccota bacterium]